MARSVNIGFNFQTTNASKSLKDLLNDLKLLNKEASKSPEIKIKINQSTLKETQKAMKELVPSKTIQGLEEMVILADRLKSSLGKNSKLDYTTVKMYEENLDKAVKTAERLKSVFKDTDLLGTLDSKQIAELYVDLKELKRTFGSTKNDIIGFTEEHIKSTKAIESLARKIENQKRALSELSKENISSKSSVDVLSKSYSNLGNKLYTALKNVDYTQLDSLQREFKTIESQHKSLIKQLSQPVKKIDMVSAFPKETKNLESIIEKSMRNLQKGIGSDYNRNNLEQAVLQGKILNNILSETDKSIDSITFTKLKTDFDEIVEKIKIGNKELLKIKDYGIKSTSIVGKSQTLELPKNVDLMKEMGLKSQKVGAIYGVQNIKFEPAFKSDIQKIMNMIEEADRTMTKIDGKDSIKSSLESAVLEAMYLIDKIKLIDKNSDAITLSKFNIDIKESIANIKTLTSELTTVKDYGIRSSPAYNGKSQNLELPKFKVDATKFNADLMAFKYTVTGDLNELTEQSKKFMGSFLSDKGLKSNLDSIISSINRLQTEMSQVGTNTKGLDEYRNELKKLQSDYNKMSKSTGESIGGTLTQFAGYYAMLNVGRTAFRGFMELEDATYNLGVVAQKSKYEMEDLRKTVIGMSIGTANTATEMANAMNTVMRAGMDYATAQAVVSATSKLAVASGEDLASSIDIVNKIFIALKINAEDADEAVQDLHATATFTATDMEGLGSSARQYIGALGVLASTTSKNNEELGKYRVSLMKTGNALTGILANMGKDFAQPIKLISKRCA